MRENNTTPHVEEKRQRLAEIDLAVQKLDSSPLYAYRKEHGYQPVIGEGNHFARIMFIGEAPGKQEALSGRPFVGRAGQLLDEMLTEIGLHRKDVYITNIVKDRPPHNRDPKASEIETYAPFLIAQIKIIDPKVIVTLGRFAMNFILQRFSLPEYGGTIGNLHGQVLQAETDLGPIKVMPLYHPAALFYNRGLEEILHEDFHKLKQFL